jgi:amylosucrase
VTTARSNVGAEVAGADLDPQSLHHERVFTMRFERSRDDLFPMLERLYGGHRAYSEFVDALVDVLRRNWRDRPEDLKWLDLERDLEPDWFQRSDQVGYVFYIDRFNGDLNGILDKLDWLEALGVTYVHLMPCLRPRPGDNDGGYSVMDYRSVNPAYGTMDDLEGLAKVLRKRGVSLCIDLVLNHTAKEHEWAVRARAREEPYLDYYLTFPDHTLPAAYEESLVEIFPDQAPGSFTWYPDFSDPTPASPAPSSTGGDDEGRWVWTTFNEHQWDLNWANPWVFLEILDIALYLANRGATVLRLDAVAFMWKRMGTRCQSEPEVHMILQAFRAATRIAASSVIHLEEAIVSPEEMIPYLGAGEHTGKEGNLAYHNSLMVQFWSALASRDTRLMTHVLSSHFPPAVPNATYATYIRCHDDIGWAVTDADAAAVGLSGFLHRRFLAEYYTGEFPMSPARGTLFQVNPKTNDARVNGTAASLAGLEEALERQAALTGGEGLAAGAPTAGDGMPGHRAADDAMTDREVGDAINQSIDRILLGHALIASYGGIPLIYMGDEIALLNAYEEIDPELHPEQAGDGRWIHRPHMDWERAERAWEGEGVEGRVLAGIRHILMRRRLVPEFHGGFATTVLPPPDHRLFAFARPAPAATVVCVYNVSPDPVALSRDWLAAHGVTFFHDLLSDQGVSLRGDHLRLPGYARLWLR